ncbi:hypothetical protein EV424DRAFT_431294 [Suillus variegatus]|nr:hypothetical protein EV424DRAFT_431294 [Suillus variegatus]
MIHCTRGTMKGRMKGRAGFIFQYVIRRRNFAWWTKYNYVLSAALDAGLAVSIIFIFFVLQYPANGSVSKRLSHLLTSVHVIPLDWGGLATLVGQHGRLSIELPAQTTNAFTIKVYYKTADGMGTPVSQLQGSVTFGYVDLQADHFGFVDEPTRS